MVNTFIYKKVIPALFLFVLLGAMTLYYAVSDEMESVSKVSGIKADLGFLLPQETAVARDPFQYIEKNPVAVVPVETVDHQQEKKHEVNPVIPEIKKGPLDGFSYVGMLVKGGERHAFILDNEQRYVAAAGDVIASRFMVSEISRDRVVLLQQPSGKKLLLHAGGGSE